MRKWAPKQSRAGEAAFTLIELMVTIAIVAILAAAIGRTMAREDNSGAVKLFTQRLLVSLRQARNTAVNSRATLCVKFTSATAYQIERASIAGAIPLASTGSTCLDPTVVDSNAKIIVLDDVVGSGAAQIVTVAEGAKPQATTSPTSLSTAALPNKIIFTPDGQVTNSSGERKGFTIFLQDRNAMYFGKVLIFKTTGFAYSMGQW